MEHTTYDHHTARVTNPNLSTYLVAVNADVPELEVMFVDKPDPVSTALGARGFGECPMTGVPAAIGNAVYHRPPRPRSPHHPGQAAVVGPRLSRAVDQGSFRP